MPNNVSNREKHKTFIAKAISVVIAALIGLASIFGINSLAHATPDTPPEELSFYALSSSLASFFSDSLAPESESVVGEGNEQWTSLMSNPATAGSLLGYADSNRNDGAPWLISSFTAGSTTMNYQAYEELPDGLQGYLYYGATLKGLGFDSPKQSLALNIVSKIGGSMIMGLAWVASGVSTAFSLAISFLQFMNPFNLLYEGFKSIAPNMAEAMISGDTNSINNGFMAGVAGFVSSIVRPLYDLSWGLIIPLFIATTILMITIGKKGGSDPKKSTAGRLKTLAIRIVFLAVGIPLLGSMYTASLAAMADATDSSRNVPYEQINSIYIDFESWAMNGNLRPPDGTVIEWDTSAKAPSTSTITRMQETAKAVNEQYNASGNMIYTGGGQYVSNDSAIAEDIVSRYTSGATINGSDYESRVKAALTASLPPNGTEDPTTVSNWFKKLQGNAKNVRDNEDYLSGNLVVNTNNNSGLNADFEGNLVKYSSSASQNCIKVANDSYDYSGFLTGTCNLAPLAMYNYLNTTFGSESFTVYSSKLATSGATRESHASVNLIGSNGIVSGTLWFVTMTMLISVVIIGLFYAVSIMFTSMRRSIQLIAATPFALLGSIGSIARVIVYVFALIIELIGTMFLFILAQKLLYALTQIPTTVMTLSPLVQTSTAMTMVTGQAGLVLLNLISTLLIGGFTWIAVRLRKSILRSIEESITKFTNAFMGTQVGAPGAGSVAPAIAGAAGGAAGLMALSGAGRSGPSLNVDGPAGGEAAQAVGADGGSGGDAGEGQDSSATGSEEAGASGIVSAGGSGMGVSDEDGGQVASDAALEDVGREVASNGLTPVDETEGQEVPSDALTDVSQAVAEDAKADKESAGKALGAAKDAGLAAAQASAGDVAGAAQSGQKSLKGATEAKEAHDRANHKGEDVAAPKPATAPKQAQDAKGEKASAGKAASGGKAQAPKVQTAEQLQAKSQRQAQAAKAASRQKRVNAAQTAVLTAAAIKAVSNKQGVSGAIAMSQAHSSFKKTVSAKERSVKLREKSSQNAAKAAIVPPTSPSKSPKSASEAKK